jgi:hypothetical protein
LGRRKLKAKEVQRVPDDKIAGDASDTGGGNGYRDQGGGQVSEALGFLPSLWAGYT